MSKFQGSWSLVESINMDDFLIARGVDSQRRNEILNKNSIMTFDIQGQTITSRMKSEIKNTENVYISGVARELKSPWNGQVGIITYTLENDSKMIGTIDYAEDGTTVYISREITSDNYMLQIMEYKDVICRRKFAKVEK